MKALITTRRIAIGTYVILTILIYFLMFSPHVFESKPNLFFQDSSLAERIHTTIISDHNGNRSFIARSFFNKGTFLIGNVLTSFTRATDPIFIFGLSQQHPFYDNYYSSPLPFWEFPLFIIAVITLIKKWEKQQRYLLIMLSFSLLFASLFLSSFTLKYFPLVITIELITGIGLYSFFVSIKKLCLKK